LIGWFIAAFLLPSIVGHTGKTKGPVPLFRAPGPLFNLKT